MHDASCDSQSVTQSAAAVAARATNDRAMTMYRIAPQNLGWAMDNLVNGVVVNEIAVDDETKHYAGVALERMISLTEKKG